MYSSSKHCTSFCASKLLSSVNTTVYAVSSEAKSAATIVKIFCLPQNRDLHGMVDVSMSKVNFKGIHPKIVSPLLSSSHQMKTMHARKNQMVILRI